MKADPTLPHRDPHRALRVAAEPTAEAELRDAFTLLAAAAAALLASAAASLPILPLP